MVFTPWRSTAQFDAVTSALFSNLKAMYRFV
jgi:hypothetical protein